jgi:hypothetical protein
MIEEEQQLGSSAGAMPSISLGNPHAQSVQLFTTKRQVVGSFELPYSKEPTTHLSLNKDVPISRAAETAGRILCRPILGGPRQGTEKNNHPKNCSTLDIYATVSHGHELVT